MGKTRFLEMDEARALLEIPDLKTLTGLRNRCLLQVMFEAGLRIGEAIRLGPRDVILAEKRIEVLHGKGDRQRTAYFASSELALLIKRWKEVRPQGSPFLFCTIRSKNKGSMLDPRSFRFTFDRYVAEAGLPTWVTPHVLRHTFATHLSRKAGVSLRTVQDALGHQFISTTTRYVHVSNQDVRRAIQGES